MPNAPVLTFIFDTDALAQIFISGKHSILRDLYEQFGVASYLMSEVEVELLSNRRVSGLVRPVFEKAVKNGWIKVLSAADLERISESLEREVSLQDIRELASDLKLFVQNGEAHTHAAAILLKCPSVSNDVQALRVLQANDKPLPATVLRSHDLFGFCFREGLLTATELEGIRTNLLKWGEWLPVAIKNTTFEAGLHAMNCRLSTSLAAQASSHDWTAVFYLPRKRNDS